MKHHRRYLSTALASLFVAYGGAASGAVLYIQTLGTTPAAVTTANPFVFENCLAAQGCFGNAGLVDTPGGNMPAAFTFTFTLTPAEITAVTTNPGSAVLRVVAARDIGHKVGEPAVDVVVASFEGSALATLFQNTIDTCPAGHNEGTVQPLCGPNFNTDVTALDVAAIGQAAFQAAAADGSIQVVLDPTTPPVGRIKIFSVALEYSTAEVPEPSTLFLSMLALGALGFARRKKSA